MPRPGEFGAQYREANRNDDKCRPGRDNHDDSEQHDRAADHRHSNSTCRFVSQVYGLMNHVLPQ